LLLQLQSQIHSAKVLLFNFSNNLIFFTKIEKIFLSDWLATQM
jgi:hypothetical protein